MCQLKSNITRYDCGEWNDSVQTAHFIYKGVHVHINILENEISVYKIPLKVVRHGIYTYI